jgi:uncharacterized protein
MNENFLDIQEYVTGIFSQPGSHGLDHTLRVTELCKKIGTREQADLLVLIPAALLHDIARPIEEKTGIPHEEEGARMAEAYLTSIRYPSHLITCISHAILTHRFSTSHHPETLEARILSDADKLDATGAIGIARAFINAGERGGDICDAIDHINEKLLKLSDRMYTPSARELAVERHQVLNSFLSTLISEMNSIC